MPCDGWFARALVGCTTCSRSLVGPAERAFGIDNTIQREVADRTVEWHRKCVGYDEANTVFHEGSVEDLSRRADGRVDAVVAVCEVDLSPQTDLVLAKKPSLHGSGVEAPPPRRR